MDELADELGVDPLEVREKNWIKHEEFPFTTVAGLEYDSGNYEAATAKAKEIFGYDELRAEQKRRRESNDPVQLGHRRLHVHRDVRPRALAGCSGSLNYGAGGWEQRLDPDARRPARSRSSPAPRRTARATRPPGRRSSPTGSGCPFEDVEVLHGDTQVAPKGMDTYGSRSLVVGGEALVRAADKVIEKAKPIAAHLLEASVDDIEFKAGRFGVKGTDKGLAMAEIALAAFAAHNLPDGHRAHARRRRDVRPGGLLLPARHPPVRGGDRHRDRWPEDAQVRLRRRHRQHRQPADRRRPGARRPGAGHRAGAVGGGRLRRRRHAGVRVVRRLPRADRCRHDQLRHRPHHVAVDDQHARAPRASARRAPSPRRRPWSTPWSTRCGRSASTTCGCRARRSGSDKAIHAQDGAQSGGGATEGAATPHFDEAGHGRPRPTGARQ